MPERVFERYDIKDEISSLKKKKIYFRPEFNENSRFFPTDISLKGIGFFGEDISEDDIHRIREKEGFFIKFFNGELSFIVSVNHVWSSQSVKGSVKIIKGGLEIDMISPNDNILLQELIKYIRSV